MFGGRFRKTEEMIEHEMICAIYIKNLQVKTEYFNEISKTLIRNKIEYASLKNQEVQRVCKKVKFTDFTISDLLGIQRVEIHIKRGNDLKPEVFFFFGMNEEFFKKFLLMISRNKTFTVNVQIHKLLINNDEGVGLKNPSKIFSMLPHFDMYSDSASTEPQFHKMNTDYNENSSDSSIENELTFAEKKYRKTLNSQFNKKRLKRKIRERLTKYFIPKKLKEVIFEKMIRNYNRVDSDFVNSLSNTERCLPKNISKLMEMNITNFMNQFNLNDEFLSFEIRDSLKLLYYYRPDIGYKTGMEIFAGLLGVSCHKIFLREILFSVILDYDLLFSVFKSCATVEYRIKERLLDNLQSRLKCRVTNPDFIWCFFIYLVSNCFSRLMNLENMLFFKKKSYRFGCLL